MMKYKYCNLKFLLMLISFHFLSSYGIPEENEESDKQDPGVINVIEYGKICNKNYPEACKHYPNVECVKNSRGISTCRCNFLKTWNKDEEKCILNVFAPCSSPDSDNGNDDLPCGENMDCILDTLGIKNIKFCRCRKGYKPMDNKESIPAFCVTDPKFEDLDEYENPEDYEHGGAINNLLNQNVIMVSLIGLIIHSNYILC